MRDKKWRKIRRSESDLADIKAVTLHRILLKVLSPFWIPGQHYDNWTLILVQDDRGSG